MQGVQANNGIQRWLERQSRKIGLNIKGPGVPFGRDFQGTKGEVDGNKSRCKFPESAGEPSR